jgi:hypothetical protein
MRTALISGFTLGIHGTAPLLVHRKTLVKSVSLKKHRGDYLCKSLATQQLRMTLEKYSFP